MTKCLTCGGAYSATQPDGMQYFHRCPPLSFPELTDAVAKGKVTLPAGETIDIAFARRSYERNALRDENIPSTRAVDAGKMKAPGAGVATVPDLAPAVVVATA